MRRITSRFAHDTRGAVTTEYTVLIGTMAIVSMLAFVALGAALVRSFEHVRSYVLFPFP